MPADTPKAEQTIEDLAPRITQARRDLMDAIEAEKVDWHYPRAPQPPRTAQPGKAAGPVS